MVVEDIATLTITQAARRLRMTEGGLRQRVYRHVQEVDGRMISYVTLEDEAVEFFKDQNGVWRVREEDVNRLTKPDLVDASPEIDPEEIARLRIRCAQLEAIVQEKDAQISRLEQVLGGVAGAVERLATRQLELEEQRAALPPPKKPWWSFSR